MLFTKNYAGLKTLKLTVFVILSVLLFSLSKHPDSSVLLTTALLACMLIPAHYAEMSLSKKLSLSVDSSFVVMFIGGMFMLQETYKTSLSLPLFSLLPLIGLYVLSIIYYRKYKDFSEDKYIYFVVSMGALLFAFLLWDKNFAIALSFLGFGIVELVQWIIYFFARKRNKDAGISAFELVIPFSLLILCYLVNALHLTTVIFTLLIIPVSYYLYIGIIKIITRMHLYAVFLQFLLFCLVISLFEKNLLFSRLTWLTSNI